MSSLISCVAWVKKGAAVQNPTKYAVDEKELKRVSELARIELEDARVELERASEAAKEMETGVEDDGAGEEDNEADWEDEKSDAGDQMDEDPPPKADPDDLSAYKLDEYDKQATPSTGGLFSNIKGLTYYKDSEEDPYITLADEDQDEREDLEILPTDNLLVVAKTEDDISQLEIYVYEEAEDNLYVHHDLMLPAFPLCLEWLDFTPSSSTSPSSSGTGNYIAVGTFDPEIEIWSLDVVEALFPDALLGRADKSAAHVPVPMGTGKKKKKKTKPRKTNTAYHVDAVLSLSWNRTHRNLLASGSADKTVKLWDLSRCHVNGGDEAGEAGGEAGGAIRSFDVHSDKVQAVHWNQAEPTVLLTGSYDRTVRTFDSRSPTNGLGVQVGSDVEALRWDPWESHGFFVSLENGHVLNFDARTLSSDVKQVTPARFTLAAHEGAASALDVNPHIRGCLATGGTDKMVKIWNINSTPDGKKDVSLVTSRDLGVGKVFSAVFSPDDPLTIAAGGSKSKVQIWDVSTNAGARAAFSKKLAEAGRALREKSNANGGVVGVASDNEDDTDDDED